MTQPASASAAERFYTGEPDAPKPNQPLVPGVSAVIFDDRRRILVMKRARSDYWSLPGGRMDIGESAQDCCARETREETGLDVRILRLVSVGSDPGFIIEYPDGNVYQSFVVCFEAEVVGGQLEMSVESEEFRWIAPDQLDDCNLLPDSRQNALDAWTGQPAAFIR